MSLLALLVLTCAAAQADQFDRIENSPYTYWVPAPTPGYAQAGPYQPAYYGPAPGYYYPPPAPPPPVVVLPGFFLHFRFH